jgi:23S rRNA (cytidine2498-2'-O)-methyltransferase
VNALAQGVLDLFAGGLRGERIESPWPCVFAGSQDAAGLGRRAASVEAAFLGLLKRKLGRVAKLATPEKPRVGPARGLFVWFTDFGRAQVARTAHMNGPCRMADDEEAPSRSYLKVEESYAIIGAEPRPGESVCDLGAAPGGWSYSAAKRGASVVAVDNGPMKGGALGHPLIVRPWLEGAWCRRFVVNLKFGRVDPIALLAELRSPESPFATRADGVRIVHLYHDREEFTVTGTVR